MRNHRHTIRPRAFRLGQPGGRLLAALLAAGLVRGETFVPAEGVLSKPEGRKLAVAVFAQNERSEAWVRTAQARLELILADNGATVLDEAKTQELKDVSRLLADPTAFITAETFLKAAQQFSIDGLLAVYLTVEVVPGLADYHTATAHADVRHIDQATARVAVLSTPSMGRRGMPPSDGLTASSAAINAVQRAIDAACDRAGLHLAERAEPRSVDLALAGPVEFAGGPLLAEAQPLDPSLAETAPLETGKWLTEEATCTARAQGGALAAVAGYLRDTDLRRRPERLYGSRIHVLDTAARQTLLTLECSPVAVKARDEPNTKRVVACLFLGNWRILCAATGNHLLLWDVERGRELARVRLATEPTGLAAVSVGDGVGVVVRSKAGDGLYRLVRK